MVVLRVNKAWLLVGLAGVILAAVPQAFSADSESEVETQDAVVQSRSLLQPLVGPPARPFIREHGVDLEKAISDDDYFLVDLCVQAAMVRGQTPGAAVAVSLDGVLVHEQGFGVKSRGGDEPVNPRTVFRIGSITKMMTAAAVMQQVDLGRVTLDDPVTRWVPEFAVRAPWMAEHITVRHLLTHSSGFPDNLFTIDGRTDDEALGDWAAALGVVPLHAAPGSFWNYSNPNFMIAGLVAERASGVAYHELMVDEVWEPAGMHATTLIPDDVMTWGDWSWGHYTNPNTGWETQFAPDDYDNWAAAPAGWAFSTARDLVHWADLLMKGGNPVLSSDAAALMQSPLQSTHYTATEFYGLGVFTDSYNGVTIKQHGGNIPGWGSFLLWVPERRFAVAVLANTFEAIPDAAFCIADAVLDLEDVPPGDDTTDPGTWGPFAGVYDVVDVLSHRSQAFVTWTGEALELEIAPPGYPGSRIQSPLVQVYSSTFLADLDEDGILDTDVTFISRPGEPSPVHFIRNRSWVVGRNTFPKPDGSRSAP